MNKEKRIPTIIGLIILTLCVFVGAYFTGGQKILNLKASGECKPGTLQITNITHDSLNISFQTPTPCLSSLTIDNRTISGVQSIATKVHYFQVNNLKEDTVYPFSLINNGTNYDKADYKARTAKKPLRPIPVSNLAWGRIYTPDLKPATNVIIYLNIPGAAPLSSFITSDGHWNISLATSLNENKTDWFSSPIDPTEEEIIVIDENNQPTQITSNTSRNNPVPDIIIGQNSFSSVSIVAPTESIPNLMDSNQPVVNNNKLQISNPKDNETLSTQKPDFFGTGPVNSKISIKVESPVVIDGEITSSTNGSWHWSPPQDLSPGEHTITVSVQNPKTGIKEFISRKFIVSAQDNSLAFSASPSATLVPTPTSVAITTATATPTPTLVATATATPTAIIRASKPSTTSGVPATGTTGPTIAILVLATASILGFYICYKKYQI